LTQKHHAHHERSGKPDSERERRLLLFDESLLVSELSDDDFFIGGDELPCLWMVEGTIDIVLVQQRLAINDLVVFEFASIESLLYFQGKSASATHPRIVFC